MDELEKSKIRKANMRKIEIDLVPFDLGNQLGMSLVILSSDGERIAHQTGRFFKPVDEITNQELVQCLIQVANELMEKISV